MQCFQSAGPHGRRLGGGAPLLRTPGPASAPPAPAGAAVSPARRSYSAGLRWSAPAARSRRRAPASDAPSSAPTPPAETEAGVMKRYRHNYTGLVKCVFCGRSNAEVWTELMRSSCFQTQNTTIDALSPRNTTDPTGPNREQHTLMLNEKHWTIMDDARLIFNTNADTNIFMHFLINIKHLIYFIQKSKKST